MGTRREGLTKQAFVSYRDETVSVSCPYGRVQRIVTGGRGGTANVHVVTVSKGDEHVHADYDETYYVLNGQGTITLDGKTHSVRPGAVVFIPAGTSHSLAASPDNCLEFVIFGTPGMPIDDPRATPRKNQTR